MFLYKIHNLTDSKQYVGITNNIKRRWKEHRSALKHNKHWNPHLQHAWNLYGEKAFVFEIIKQCLNDTDIQKAEINYIQQYDLTNQKNGYNIDTGGRGMFQHTDYTKQKISQANLVPVVSMHLKTGDIKKYNSILDVKKDGLKPKSITGPCSGRVLTHANRVWMYWCDYLKNPHILIEKKNNSQNTKARPSIYTHVFGMNIKTRQIIFYKAMLHANKDGFNNTSIRGCLTRPMRYKSHKGYVWAYTKEALYKKIMIALNKKTHRVT